MMRQLIINTPLGALTAYPSNDSDNPGIWIELDNAPVALIECTSDEADLPENMPHIITRVWNGGDDYETRVVYGVNDALPD
ncbi:MAG: hypothetical protein J6M64_12120 [Oscillospiraceae bacterium]|nr:hypothetical protein [Oscillospiraceae bacterium]